MTLGAASTRLLYEAALRMDWRMDVRNGYDGNSLGFS
jgi:hypothetical protein